MTFAKLSLPALLAAMIAIAAPAHGAEKSIRYGVAIAGIPIGKARLGVNVQGSSYRLDLYAKAKGVSRLFTDLKGSGGSAGAVVGNGLRPASYAHHFVEDNEPDAVSIGFAGRRAAKVAIEPVPTNRADRVPVTGAHKKNVTDPLSALVIRAEGPMRPDLCQRTLPIFDGRQRYDVVMRPLGIRQFKGPREAYRGPVVACSIRYRPVAGHRVNKKQVAYMRDNRNMEIWYAPIGDGLYIPVHARFKTMAGVLTFNARKVN